MAIHTIKTQDIYESAYLLTMGAQIISVEQTLENHKPICKFIISGNNLPELQNNYYNNRALVNLWDFRRSFTRVNALISKTRKESIQQKNAPLLKGV